MDGDNSRCPRYPRNLASQAEHGVPYDLDEEGRLHQKRGWLDLRECFPE
jgi:hypothetical protein